MSATVGFVVKGRFDDPMILVTRSCSLWKNIPRGGILLRDDRVATSFPTRSAARAAINRSNSYFKFLPCPSGLPREPENYEIARLINP